MAYLHSRSYGWNLVLPAKRSFVVVYKELCINVADERCSDLCHEIAIIFGYTFPLQNDLYKSETTQQP